ncbi:hypothetical protein GN956_G5710 [Arapaima gigas]
MSQAGDWTQITGRRRCRLVPGSSLRPSGRGGELLVPDMSQRWAEATAEHPEREGRQSNHSEDYDGQAPQPETEISNTRNDVQ